jgi:hypothetical protein
MMVVRRLVWLFLVSNTAFVTSSVAGETAVPTEPPAAAGVAAGAAVTAADLQLPAEAHPGVTAVTVRALGVDDPTIPDERATPEIRALRLSGQLSAANYRYRFGGDHPGQIKVRVDVFRDAATATEQFRRRHLPEALAQTKPLDAGEDGYFYEDDYAGFRSGPVVVELHATGADGELPAFARRYAELVAERLATADKAAAASRP